jgi:hypothetical protein
MPSQEIRKMPRYLYWNCTEYDSIIMAIQWQ